MFIKEIELNNFRIYKGRNKVEILPEDDKNIIVVSGKNGFGKSTFLMSLVWCLYGRQMEKVDELYKKEIHDKGGYGKFIGNSLNRLASAQGETKFSVSVTFTNVKIPDVTCNEIKVTRSFDTKTGTQDSLEILIDGQSNELILDLSRNNQDGGEIFIREFVLPIEIAKFFFFDAEKIVSLAEVSSPEQRRALGVAYSEVLGIHKYEELKDQLESLQDDYRKKAAKPADRNAFIDLQASIEKTENLVDDLESQIEDLKEEKVSNKHDADEIQRKLIKEGNHMTLEQVEEFKSNERKLEEKLNELSMELRDLFDLIPFGLAGEVVMDVSKQLELEKTVKQAEFKEDDSESKTDDFLNELEQRKNSSEIIVDTKIRRFYEDQIKDLIKKHFYGDADNIPTDFVSIHDFSESQTNQFNGIINNLIHSFKETYTRLNGEYSSAKFELDSIRRKLREAEKNAEDTYIADLREQKAKYETRISEIEESVEENNQKLGAFKNDLKAFRQQQEELRKKLDVSDSNKENNAVIEHEIKRLKDFIIKFKEEKKKSLESKIKEGLNLLMHKKNFISKVDVFISPSGEDVEITLYSKVKGKEHKIDKGSLSMGERQMYSSALLSALVDESNIDFPVFIDSPMQKFDKEHAVNIIKHFYPHVSDQVILFPLIHKELTGDEYDLLKNGVSKSYLIHNTSNDSSTFIEVEPEALIEKYDQQYVASN